jgi:beta-lactamase class A
MNPDGTGQREFYGSGGYWPNAIFYARPIPNSPTKFVGIVTGHHVGRAGDLVLFDVALGRQSTEGVIQRIPGYGRKVEPVIEDKLTLDVPNIVEGSGVLADLTPGLQLTVKDVAMLMVIVSDNTATNMLVDLVSIDAVNRSLQELGVTGVKMNRKIGINLDKPLGEATPAGMARLMQLIAQHEVLRPQECIGMIDILKRQQHKELTNRFIPETDDEDDNPAVRIASKSGWVRGVRNDVALIWAPRSTYVLAMFSKNCKDRRFYHDNEAAVALARVSQAVYETWGKLHQEG